MRDGVFLRVFIFINRFMELLEMIKDNGDGTISIKAPCSFEKPSREEALKLADELQKHFNCYNEYSDMIRILVEELDKHKQINGVFDYYCDENIRSKQTKPLSDEEIDNLYVKVCVTDRNQIITRFARAIEERHGIK